MLIDTSVSAGTASATGSLSTAPWMGTSTDPLPPNVIVRRVAGSTDDPLVRIPIDAEVIVSGPVLFITFENFTRTWSPPTVSQTGSRSVTPAVDTGSAVVVD